MAYTTIDDPTIYFNTLLYTGNGSQRNITGVGFQPDWIWGKNRSATGSHNFVDSVRGVSKVLYANLNDAEATDTSSFNAFGSDGFSVGSQSNVNGNSNNIVSWNWKAGGSASSNSDGSITSSVSANTTAGFSIVSWTGTGSAATIGHGLGAVPTMIIVKNRTDSGADWYCYNVNNGNTHSILLNTSGGKVGAYSDNWNNTTPTSSVFTVGSSNSTGGSSGDNMIAYVFTDIKGYSKFGSYTGNGNADGTFVYTGFKPAFLLTKKSSGSGDSWNLLDATRNPGNPGDKRLTPDTSNAEATTTQYDLLSNGFKARATTGAVNTSGATYIYMAFSESPFVNSNGIPNNAR